MKKSLFALAALTAFAGAAQAQSSSVTLYGLLDAGVRIDNNVNTSGNNNGSQTTFASGVLNTSRWGVKGTEDLGGGLKANFNLESGLTAGTGAQSQASTLFDRRAIVGLEGAFGRVDLGRNTTFGYDMIASYVTDPLGAEYANQSTYSTFKSTAINPLNLIYGSGLATVRRDNSIKYTYQLDAFRIGAMYSVGGIAGSTTPGSSLQGNVLYSANNVQVAATYDDLADLNSNHQRTINLGGNYSMGNLKFTAGYATVKEDSNFSSASLLTLGTSSLTTISAYISNVSNVHVATSAANTVKVYDLGLTYQATPSLNIVGAYYQTQYSSSDATVAAGQKYDTYIARARYALSKRTDLYAGIDYTKAAGANSTSTNNTAQTSSTGVAAGVQHRF